MQYRNSTYGESSFDTYWFEKNLQGDIVAVYNEGGTKLVSYTYDDWGKIEISEHNLSGTNFNATYNPFRYRGYYYDSELGFYYLNSRYYDPETGRFISIDSLISGAYGSVLGKNLFAYCFNNPITFVDPNGNFPWVVVAVILAAGAVVGGVLGGLSDKKLGPTNSKSDTEDDEELTFKDRVNNVAVGAASGLAVSGTVLILWGVGGSLVAGSAAVALPFLGTTGAQTVAWGILAYDILPIFIAPFFGMEMEVLEYPS